jgi:hypothetical protein
MAPERQTEVEARIRAAMHQLLVGPIPNGLKCDIKSLCTLAGVPRATLYRTYPHLKAEFDRQRTATQPPVVVWGSSAIGAASARAGGRSNGAMPPSYRADQAAAPDRATHTGRRGVSAPGATFLPPPGS